VQTSNLIRLEWEIFTKKPEWGIMTFWEVPTMENLPLDKSLVTTICTTCLEEV
jgi:hypothetical protein